MQLVHHILQLLPAQWLSLQCCLHRHCIVNHADQLRALVMTYALYHCVSLCLLDSVQNLHQIIQLLLLLFCCLFLKFLLSQEIACLLCQVNQAHNVIEYYLLYTHTVTTTCVHCQRMTSCAKVLRCDTAI